ncbi:MAG: site-specific DNA-methyltransferase [Chloroflexota bacterium]
MSFQANKDVPFYSWFKYREGFSEPLVRYLLQTLHPAPGVLLDPFAGGGSALFAASNLDWCSTGIEVLPVGIHAMRARIGAHHVDHDTLAATVSELSRVDYAAHYDEHFALRHIAITRGAFPEHEERQLVGYIAYCHIRVADDAIRTVLLYAAFCVLEDMSFTRKDGQYLRWDARSGRSQGKRPFNKGRILSFREAISGKLQQIVTDLGLGPRQQPLFSSTSAESSDHPVPQLLEGSCLEILPTMPAESFDFVLTSPPYANRYDYTRTYALELVFLGQTEDQVKRLRQAMLSCTVENRTKRDYLRSLYEGTGRLHDFELIDSTFRAQAALREVLGILDGYRQEGRLNNDNIARLVRNYFYELCFVIYELARLLKPGGVIAMVNDNVRYAGEEVPVDLILTDFAESFGLAAPHIWTLGKGKGNSSQQMGSHGRTELRKCVYVWEKPR